jgi:hypothetical protein
LGDVDGWHVLRVVETAEENGKNKMRKRDLKPGPEFKRNLRLEMGILRPEVAVEGGMEPRGRQDRRYPGRDEADSALRPFDTLRTFSGLRAFSRLTASGAGSQCTLQEPGYAVN